MGSAWEDVEIAIIYPFLSVLLFFFIWKFVISKLSYCIIGLSDKMINELVIGIAHLASLQRMSPYEGEFLPTPKSTEVILLFSATYYLKTAFYSDSKMDISYNLMLFISILDLVSFKKGGDTTLYFLCLLEAPDFISTYLGPFLRSEACYDMVYTVQYIVFKICFLGHLIYKEIMNSKISEDLKMNIFIIYLYVVLCLPALLCESYRFYSGELDTPLPVLPQISRKRLEVQRYKAGKRRSYSRGRRR